MVKFHQNGEEITSEALKFPITELGTATTVSFMIENDSEDNAEYIFYSDDGDLTAVDYPKHLKPRETYQAKIQFSPPLDRPDSLHTTFGFREILG